MSTSRLTISADGDITLRLSAGAQLLGVSLARQLLVASSEVVGVWRSDALTVGRRLRWKIAGTALSRQRAIGWFSWIGHRRQWAWVWLTPHRDVVVIETRRLRPALLVVPADWCTGVVVEQLPVWRAS